MPVASAAMVAALPALPAARAAEVTLLAVPELVGELTKPDSAAVGLMADVTFDESCSNFLPAPSSSSMRLAAPFPAIPSLRSGCAPFTILFKQVA